MFDVFRMGLLLLLLVAAGYGRTTRTVAEHQVTVCSNALEVDAAGLDAIGPARLLAQKMFAGIGLKLEWRNGLRNCPEDSIIVSLSGNTPATLKPGALASASFYNGAHIEVFYDRVARYQAIISTLLGHVLVHEITHVLQGINRHSESGIMKADWDDSDLSSMRPNHTMKFTPQDISLIYLGLMTRAHRPLPVINCEPGVLASKNGRVWD